MPHEHKTMLELRLENRGSEPASNITARIIPKAQYKLEEWESPPRRLASLTPQSAQTLEFTIFPEDISARLVEVGIEVLYEAGTVQKAKSFALPVTLAPPRKTFVPIKNPYVAGPPLDPRRSKAVFIGREHTFDQIVNQLRGKFQQNILVVHGQRRTGKTSLLLQLCYDRLKPPYYPVFLDMQSFADVGTYSFFYKMARQITEVLAEHDMNMQVLPRRAFLEGGFDIFNQFLDTVESHLQGGYLVLMLDEFEELEQRVRNGKIDPDIFSYLRSQMQHRNSIIFIFAGTHRLEELSKDYFGIFFNAAIYHEIGSLEGREAEALIRQPVASVISYEDRAVNRILHATNNHPYFVQLICYHLVNLMNREERNTVTPLE